MRTRTRLNMMVISIFILASLVLSACGAAGQANTDLQVQSSNGESIQELAGLVADLASSIESQSSDPVAILEQAIQVIEKTQPDLLDQSADTALEAPVADGEPSGLMAAYQGALQQVYEDVGPSVVNIQVWVKNDGSAMGSEMPFDIPGFPGAPDGSLPEAQPYSQGLGSGFVWDKDGHIVTNNHVVGDADKIEVTFADGTTAPADLVGADPDSDLAVIKVDLPKDALKPVEMGDSANLKVGQLAIAIGNPYGLEGTMTVGIISALGRTLPANLGINGAPSYSIPDVIQTDAPINPGNSGGVLVNDQGQVIGVTFAIESESGSNAGIGFVIPAAIVERVAPALIENGYYEHPYIGISGGTLTRQIAEVMGLDSNQRGVLVASVSPNSPADKAGLRASENTVEIDGQETTLGGDVITSIDGTEIKGMDDLIAYLANHTGIGQTVTLDVLREGEPMRLELTLAARPSQTTSSTMPETEQESVTPAPSQGGAWMGIDAATLDAAMAQAFGLDANQQGVFVRGVAGDSPAQQAGLAEGDVITAINGDQTSSVEELVAMLAQYQPGDEITLSVVRNGEALELTLTLASRPS